MGEFCSVHKDILALKALERELCVAELCQRGTEGVEDCHEKAVGRANVGDLERDGDIDGLNIEIVDVEEMRPEDKRWLLGHVWQEVLGKNNVDDLGAVVILLISVRAYKLTEILGARFVKGLINANRNRTNLKVDHGVKIAIKLLLELEAGS